MVSSTQTRREHVCLLYPISFPIFIRITHIIWITYSMLHTVYACINITSNSQGSTNWLALPGPWIPDECQSSPIFIYNSRVETASEGLFLDLMKFEIRLIEYEMDPTSNDSRFLHATYVCIDILDYYRIIKSFELIPDF